MNVNGEGKVMCLGMHGELVVVMLGRYMAWLYWRLLTWSALYHHWGQ